MGALLLLLGGSLRAATGPALHLKLVNDGDQRFHIEATAFVLAPREIAWETLRDYDHMSEFIPMLIVSRRTKYDGAPAIEQVGEARFLMFRFRAKTILAEKADDGPTTVELHALAGDFSRFDSHWELRDRAGGTEMTLRSEAVLKRWIPQWLARHELQRSVRLSLNALLKEIVRRSGERKPL